MLFAMESDLQECFEKMSAFEIITDLRHGAEWYKASALFFSSRMDKHSSVSEHVVKMSGYVQRLNALEC
jgi:hypothetical protein